MPAQSKGDVIHAGAPSPEWPDRNADCEAYRAAVKKWCAETRQRKAEVAQWLKDNNMTMAQVTAMKKAGKGLPTGFPQFPSRKFNDYYYSALPSGLAQRTAREVPLGVAAHDAAGNVTGWSSIDDFATANPGTRAAATARGLSSSYDDLARGVSSQRAGFWDNVRHQLNQRAGGLGKGNSPFYPDGLRDGRTAIEIKGPGDTEGDHQFQRYADTAPDGKCIVISPKSCAVAGELTKGGRCKAKA